MWGPLAGSPTLNPNCDNNTYSIWYDFVGDGGQEWDTYCADPANKFADDTLNPPDACTRFRINPADGWVSFRVFDPPSTQYEPKWHIRQNYGYNDNGVMRVVQQLYDTTTTNEMMFKPIPECGNGEWAWAFPPMNYAPDNPQWHYYETETTVPSVFKFDF
jgi:hypothetical protein